MEQTTWNIEGVCIPVYKIGRATMKYAGRVYPSVDMANPLIRVDIHNEQYATSVVTNQEDFAQLYQVSGYKLYECLQNYFNLFEVIIIDQGNRCCVLLVGSDNYAVLRQVSYVGLRDFFNILLLLRKTHRVDWKSHGF